MEAVIAGTAAGGAKAAATNKRLHGADFYQRVGKKGGLAGRGPGYTGGFAGDKDLASRAGRIGGMKSRRRKKAQKEVTDEQV